jgi:membrane-bound lytic murein transglycosylase D
MEETLGHLSDWSLVRIQKIKELNKIKANSIPIGKKIKIPVNENTKQRFIAKRTEFHTAIQEDFFENFKIESYMDYQIKKGDSISVLAKKFRIPQWIIKRVNKDINLANLAIGQKLIIPIISSKT